MTRLFLVACLVCGCTSSNTLANMGDDGGGSDAGPSDMTMVVADDLTTVAHDLAGKPLVDLAGGDFGGVSCGNATCGASQICCVQRAGGGVSSMCVAQGGCPDGGAAAACDGPEDCSNGMPNCCATLSGNMMTMSGMAECTASCDGSLMVTGGFTVRTRLCHGDTDCAGYTGSFNGNSSAWDACCHQNANPNTHFCANSGFGGFGGYTCP